MDWYYSKDEAQHGPITQAELMAKIGSGEVSGADLAWREGMGDWKPVSSLVELQGVPAASSSGVPASPVASNPQAAMPMGVVPMGVVPRLSGLAIASLICGIVGFLGFFSCFLPGLVGIGGVICGHMALSGINKSGGSVHGKGLAIGGLVTGYIATLMILVMVLIFGAAVLFSDSSSSSYDYDVDIMDAVEETTEEDPFEF